VLTYNVECESCNRADECENDQEPAGGRVAADQVLGPVLHVCVQGWLGLEAKISSKLNPTGESCQKYWD